MLPGNGSGPIRVRWCLGRELDLDQDGAWFSVASLANISLGLLSSVALGRISIDPRFVA